MASVLSYTVRCGERLTAAPTSADRGRAPMPERMLKFVTLPQQSPEKRAATARRADFREINEEFDPPRARAQSSRCSKCGVPFYQVH